MNELDRIAQHIANDLGPKKVTEVSTGEDHDHCWHYISRDGDKITELCCWEGCKLKQLVLNDGFSQHKEWHKYGR